ncbi:hypothetical protein SAMN05444166_2730 [Singulisphaera sp. GP187]|uniref:hypothetical protein n=1 Tax=Singulisphaera sp. GP187 TaxID=1882752 RepID=UPI000926D7DB|nr:hypothetical protein [Singulisphaera sp. GP187]SIO15393.1 hypothetical protein SAMN05444166_2730 [Singulisphaera sp. GP187]
MPLNRRFGNTPLGLMVAIVCIALLLAILKHGIQSWGRSELLTLNIGILVLASIPMAIYGPSHRRAFWDGFACFGWVYLIVTLGPAPWDASAEPPPLPTTQFFDSLYPRIYPNVRLQLRREEPWDLEFRLTQHRLRYQQSCHAIASLLFGLLGGIMLKILAARRE